MVYAQHSVNKNSNIQTGTFGDYKNSYISKNGNNYEPEESTAIWFSFRPGQTLHRFAL